MTKLKKVLLLLLGPLKIVLFMVLYAVYLIDLILIKVLCFKGKLLLLFTKITIVAGYLERAFIYLYEKFKTLLIKVIDGLNWVGMKFVYIHDKFILFISNIKRYAYMMIGLEFKQKEKLLQADEEMNLDIVKDFYESRKKEEL